MRKLAEDFNQFLPKDVRAKFNALGKKALNGEMHIGIVFEDKDRKSLRALKKALQKSIATETLTWGIVEKPGKTMLYFPVSAYPVMTEQLENIETIYKKRISKRTSKTTSTDQAENRNENPASGAISATQPAQKKSLGKAEWHRFIEKGHFRYDGLLIDATTIEFIKKALAGRKGVKLRRFYKRFDPNVPDEQLIRVPREKMADLEKSMDLEQLKKRDPTTLSDKELEVLLKLPFSVEIDNNGHMFALYEGKDKEKQSKLLGSGASKDAKFTQNLETGNIDIVTRQELTNDPTEIAQTEAEAQMATSQGLQLGSILQSGMVAKKVHKKGKQDKDDTVIRRHDFQEYGGIALANYLDPKKAEFIDSFDERLNIGIKMFKTIHDMHTKKHILPGNNGSGYMLHRDLKAQNITYDEASGEMRIIDFGTAVIVPSDQSSLWDTLVGTRPALAPELCKPKFTDADNNVEFSIATDTYAAATVLMKAFGLEIPLTGFGWGNFEAGLKPDKKTSEAVQKTVNSRSAQIQELREYMKQKITELCKNMTVGPIEGKMIPPKERLIRTPDAAQAQLEVIATELNKGYENLAEQALTACVSVLKTQKLSEDRIKELLRGCKAEDYPFPRDPEKFTLQQKEKQAQREADLKQFKEWEATLTKEERAVLFPALYTLSEIPPSILAPQLTAALQKPAAEVSESPAAEVSAPPAPEVNIPSVTAVSASQTAATVRTSPVAPSPIAGAELPTPAEVINLQDIPKTAPTPADRIMEIDPLRAKLNIFSKHLDDGLESLAKFEQGLKSRFANHALNAMNIQDLTPIPNMLALIANEQIYLNKATEFLMDRLKTYKAILARNNNDPEIQKELLPKITAYEEQLQRIQLAKDEQVANLADIMDSNIQLKKNEPGDKGDRFIAMIESREEFLSELNKHVRPASTKQASQQVEQSAQPTQSVQLEQSARPVQSVPKTSPTSPQATPLSVSEAEVKLLQMQIKLLAGDKKSAIEVKLEKIRSFIKDLEFISSKIDPKDYKSLKQSLLNEFVKLNVLPIPLRKEAKQQAAVNFASLVSLQSMIITSKMPYDGYSQDIQSLSDNLVKLKDFESYTEMDKFIKLYNETIKQVNDILEKLPDKHPMQTVCKQITKNMNDTLYKAAGGDPSKVLDKAPKAEAKVSWIKPRKEILQKF